MFKQTKKSKAKVSKNKIHYKTILTVRLLSKSLKLTTANSDASNGTMILTNIEEYVR